MLVDNPIAVWHLYGTLACERGKEMTLTQNQKPRSEMFISAPPRQ
jgi:hypothetical protein